MPQQPVHVEIITFAHGNFESAMGDVKELLRHHDTETNRRPGRPSSRLEVLKRAAIIMSITAWESFIEDTIRACATSRLEDARCPADVGKWFNSVARRWLERKPKPPDLGTWAGAGWKTMLRDQLEDDLRSLNTPDSKNVANLSVRYLGVDITTKWHWGRTTSTVAAKQLDGLIRDRKSTSL